MKLVLKYGLFTGGLVSLPTMAAWFSWQLGGWGQATWANVGFLLFLPYVMLGRGVFGASKRGGRLPGWIWVAFWYTTMVVVTWFAVGYVGRMTTITLKPSDDEPHTLLRLRERDRILAVLDWPKETSTRFRGGYDKLALMVEMLGPDGWVDRVSSLTGPEPTLRDVDIYGRTTLFIDNRAHGAAAIAYGEQSFIAPAGEVFSRRVLEAVGAAPVRVDGSPAGEIQTRLQSDATEWVVHGALIDTSGRRRYRLRKVVYVNGIQVKTGEKAESWDLRPGIVHLFYGPMSPPDYFLTSAPATVPMANSEDPVSRYELHEVE